MRLLPWLALLGTGLLAACNAPAGNQAAAEKGVPTAANEAASAAPGNAADTPAEASGAALAEGAANLDFLIVNRTGREITGIAITPEGEGAPWSDDVLVQREVPDGERAAVSYTRDIELCRWAIRATFAGGETRDFPAVDLCETIRVELR